MTHDEMIAVIQAHKEGKQIQKRAKSFSQNGWYAVSLDGFNFNLYEYRIKPDPQVIYVVRTGESQLHITTTSTKEAAAEVATRWNRGRSSECYEVVEFVEKM